MEVPAGSVIFQRHVFWANRRSLNIPEDAASAAARFLSEHANGNILVFLGGIDDIRATIAAMRATLGPDGPQLHPLHARQPAWERRAASSVGTERKVIVATNVAESGLTISDIACVIDSGLCKQSWCDESTGTYHLVPMLVSQSAAHQRAGRTGRTCDGYVYCLYPYEDAVACVQIPISDLASNGAIEKLPGAAFAQRWSWRRPNLLWPCDSRELWSNSLKSASSQQTAGCSATIPSLPQSSSSRGAESHSGSPA